MTKKTGERRKKRKSNKGSQVLGHPSVDPDDRIIDGDLVRSIGKYANEIVSELGNPKVQGATVIVPVDDEFLRVAIERSYSVLDRALKPSGRRAARRRELQDLEPMLRKFVRESMDTPVFDAPLIIANDRALSPFFSYVNGAYFAVEAGVPASFFQFRGDDVLVDFDDDELVATAFVVDVVIEIIGLVCSAVHLPIPMAKGARAAIRRALDAFLKKSQNRRLLRELLELLAVGDWAAVFDLILITELMTIFGEAIAHVFAEMAFEDYLIALLKLIAWMAAIVAAAAATAGASGPAILAIKLAPVMLDLLGLGVKAHHYIGHHAAATNGVPPPIGSTPPPTSTGEGVTCNDDLSLQTFYDIVYAIGPTSNPCPRITIAVRDSVSDSAMGRLLSDGKAWCESGHCSSEMVCAPFFSGVKLRVERTSSTEEMGNGNQRCTVRVHVEAEVSCRCSPSIRIPFPTPDEVRWA
ncbi:MAG: hypothetical protein QNJ09_00615 [Paracoccaceae bacterium]|nr:hypothetical protein [Paracoccaceae bacterium]